MTVQRQCTSAVTEMSQDALVGASRENGTTIITLDLRQPDWPQELGTQATRSGRKEASHVDVHARSPFHNPITYRFIFTPGASLDAQHHRRYFTPEMQGVSTSQHGSHRVSRLACSLAVVCGVSLRHMARLFSALFLLPTTKSSVQRWMDAIGTPLPTPEELQQLLLARTPAPECPIDGSYPLGTDHGGRVVQDEHDRLLMTQEAESARGEDARQFLHR